jgi:SAM-dependent methyltransferase
MKSQTRSPEIAESEAWIGWCCPYCAAPLEARGHGLFCAAETRWLATDRGIHRLLPEERRRELLPLLELYQRVRRERGHRAEASFPEVPYDHPHRAAWSARGEQFRAALAIVSPQLGPAPWRVLEVGAGCCWASARLLERGHKVVAVDVNLDADDGLRAAERLVPDVQSLARAEADMDALPLEPGRFDLVLAVGALHFSPRPTRTLVELRRVTRRGGLLVAIDSPVYRRRPDGEARVAERMREQARRYRISVPRESQPGYFVLGELGQLFSGAGWRVEVEGWPGRAAEGVRDAVNLLRRGRRSARYPVLVAKRDG